MCTPIQLRGRLLAAIRRRRRVLPEGGLHVHERILQSVFRVSRAPIYEQASSPFSFRARSINPRIPSLLQAYHRRCWIDCYHYGATSTDFSSISLEQAIVNVNCESYSLAAESESAFYASISEASASYSSEEANTSTSSFAQSLSETAVGSGVPGIVLSGSAASQGATASLGAPQSTTEWVDRPSSTEEAQQGVGMSMKRAGRRSALVSATVVLVLISFFCNG